MIKVADRSMAVLALVAGAFALWMFASDPSASQIATLADLPLITAFRLAALLAGGAVCIVSAWRLWAAADAADETPNAPLFGRGARLQSVQSRPIMRPMLYAIPLIAIGALAAERFVTDRPGDGIVADSGSQQSDAAVGDPSQEVPSTPEANAEAAPSPTTPQASKEAASPAEAKPEESAEKLAAKTAEAEAKTAEKAKAADDAKVAEAKAIEPAPEPTDLPTPAPNPGLQEVLSQPPEFPSEPPASQSSTDPAKGTPVSTPDAPNPNWIAEATKAAKAAHESNADPAGQQTAMAPGADPAEADRQPSQTTAPPLEAPKAPTQSDGHHDAVVWLAVSADGQMLMSASTDRTVKLWDLKTRRLIRDLGAHKDMARTALFLPDGKRALTSGDDGEIVLRNVADSAVLHVFSGGEHGGANKIAISPDGRRAVSVHETGSVIIWNIDKRAVEHVIAGHAWSISSVAISPDGRLAVSGSIDGELNLWDLDDGKLLRRWLGHDRGTYGAVFTPDSRQLITGSGDLSIKIWDVASGREIRRLAGHSGTVYALALSADGKMLASCSLDGTARLWDVASGAEIVQFSPNTGALYSVAFAPDGSLLTGGVDRTIRKWPGGEILFAGAPE